MSRFYRAVLPVLALSLAACASQAAAKEDVVPAPPQSPTATSPPSPLDCPACACAAGPGGCPSGQATLSPTRTTAPPSPSPTATRVIRTPTPTATPTCAEAQGTLQQISIPSDTLNYPIDTRLYLPPCYAASERRYPVLYLFHGLNFQEDQWENLGAARAADELVAAGEIAPLIIVMPRDRRDARLDPAFVNDLVPFIDHHYRTLAAREYRALGGLSRGAGWALHLGLHYPDRFSRIGAHSPAIFAGDEHNLVQWSWRLPPEHRPVVYVDIGQGDATVHSAAWLDQVLTYSRVEHTYLLRPGAHSEQYWSAHVAEYLRFYAAGWRHLPTPTPEIEADFQPTR